MDLFLKVMVVGVAPCLIIGTNFNILGHQARFQNRLYNTLVLIGYGSAAAIVIGFFIYSIIGG